MIANREYETLQEHQQHRKHGSSRPGEEKELCDKGSQVIGNATGFNGQIHEIISRGKEKLKLLMVMQVVRIHQSKEQENGQPEQPGKRFPKMIKYLVHDQLVVLY